MECATPKRMMLAKCAYSRSTCCSDSARKANEKKRTARLIDISIFRLVGNLI